MPDKDIIQAIMKGLGLDEASASVVAERTGIGSRAKRTAPSGTTSGTRPASAEPSITFGEATAEPTRGAVQQVMERFRVSEQDAQAYLDAQIREAEVERIMQRYNVSKGVAQAYVDASARSIPAPPRPLPSGVDGGSWGRVSGIARPLTFEGR